MNGPWVAKNLNGFWYCTRNGYRIPDSFLCNTKHEAEASAWALNKIGSGDFITVSETEKTRTLYIPRGDGS